VRLVQLLEERNFRFVEVPDEEFLTEGCNVLTLRPGVVVGVAGNPVTASRLRDAGVTLIDFEGDEICKKRLSGPTCNSRPLRRAPLQAA
jgi:N-dimethylarginine dimethylaminohydrolase